MSGWRAFFGLDWEDIWTQLCTELGGEWIARGFWSGTNMVQVRHEDWLLTLDTYTVSTGKSSVTFTRLRAPFVNRDQFQFRIGREGFFTRVGKWFGLVDFEIGDPAFDEAFHLAGNDEHRVRALCGNARIRELLHLLPAVQFDVRPRQWGGPAFPDGVNELRFDVVGIIRDLPTLRRLFELFKETLDEVARLETQPADETMRHVRVLLSPGGDVEHSKVVLWDGDPPRRRAAERLGMLRDPRAVPYLCQALQDSDIALRVAVVGALGAIGERSAAPYLIAELGVEATADGQPYDRWVAAALDQLGHREQATAFQAALAAGIQDTRAFFGPLRPAFIAAFRSALERHSPHQVGHAACALADLGAVEERRAIQDALRRWRGKDSELRSTLSAVLEDLEDRSRLPRPAAAPVPEASALPLPGSNPHEELRH